MFDLEKVEKQFSNVSPKSFRKARRKLRRRGLTIKRNWTYNPQQSLLFYTRIPYIFTSPMDYGIILLLAIFSFLLGFSLIAWPFRFQGNIHLHKNSLDYSGTVSLGSKTIGLGLVYRRQSQYLFLGSIENPTFKWKLLRKRKGKKKGLPGIKTLMESWKKKRTLPIKSVLSGMWKSISWDTVGVTGQFGLDSPHLTGQAFGVFLAILNLVPEGIRGIELNPDFSGRGLNINYFSTIRVRPAVLAWRVSSSFFSRTH